MTSALGQCVTYSLFNGKRDVKTCAKLCVPNTITLSSAIFLPIYISDALDSKLDFYLLLA